MLNQGVLILFTVIALGYLLGQIRWGGISFGSSGVIFVALLFGHLGATIPEGVGKVGLVLFVYCLGINAGPSFFRVFLSQAKSLAVLGVALVVIALATTWGLAAVLDIPVDLATGILAGAMTSTPVLAACSEALGPKSDIAVGFGLAYPFGVVGVVLFVQLLPRLLGKTMQDLEQESGPEPTFAPKIVRALIEVVNPAVVGNRISEIPLIARSRCQIPRVVEDGQLVPIPPEFTLQTGQLVLAIGAEEDAQMVMDFLGRPSGQMELVMDAEQQRMQVVVGAKEIVGRTLRELKLLRRFGVTIARIMRHDVEFVPGPSERIQVGDRLTAVGENESLEKFAAYAGHRARVFDQTDIISLAIGLVAGLLLGSLKVEAGGYPMSLGMAGGPLMVGLLLGHFGRVGPVAGHFPRAARMLMSDLGLAFFLADAGVRAGEMLAPVFQQHGVALCGSAIVITTIPMVTAALIARFGMRMSLLRILGAVCGAMTSTPGLAVITGKTDSNAPVSTYAAIYPVSLILLTIGGRLLVTVLK